MHVLYRHAAGAAESALFVELLTDLVGKCVRDALYHAQLLALDADILHSLDDASLPIRYCVLDVMPDVVAEALQEHVLAVINLLCHVARAVVPLVKARVMARWRGHRR